MLFFAIPCHKGFAVDVTFNINYITEANPFPPVAGSNFSWGDVWAENGYAYVGSDRGYASTGGARGIAVFSITNSGVPTFLGPLSAPPALPATAPAGSSYAATTYYGSEMEDVEVYDGIGYFASDVNGSGGRTGVDIVDLSIPFDPILLSRVDTSDCLSGNPGVCAHGKVHTASIQRFEANTPLEQRYMYTSDNETDVIKITNVSDPEMPVLVSSLDINAPSGVASHEVAVRNNRLFIASKSSSTTTNGWTHIYDVSNPSNPQLMKAFQTGARTHTAMPSADGNTLIIAQEREGGEVRIYDISMINQTNDSDTPILRKTLTSFDASVGARATDVCRNSNGDSDCLDATDERIDGFSPHHIHIHGNLAFITWYNAGLQVFNISNPANPAYVGAFDTWSGTSDDFDGNWGIDLSLGLNRVLLSDRKRGLIVVDATGVVAQGDYNTDTFVNGSDYAAWRAAFGSTRSSVHDAPLSDGNYNGLVDAADYVLWRKRATLGAASIGEDTAVPESSTILLLAAATGALIGQQRMRVSWKTSMRHSTPMPLPKGEGVG